MARSLGTSSSKIHFLLSRYAPVPKCCVLGFPRIQYATLIASLYLGYVSPLKDSGFD